MGCFVVTEFLLTSASRGPSAIVEPVVLSTHLQVRPLTTFSCLMAQMTWTHARVYLFWLWLLLQPMGIKLPKNANFGGVNRLFPAKWAKYWNVHIIKTTASIIIKFYRVIETPNTHCWWSKYAQTNPRWRTAAIFKNRKILISSQPIDRFWRNLAYWCVSTLWTPIANKISLFQKYKMAAAILKIRKIAISPQWNDRFWQNLIQWWVWTSRYRQ